MAKHLSLAAEFPRATESDWRKLVDGVLKGADFTKKLVGQTRDGIAIMPLEGRRKDAQPIVGARGVAPWKTVARLDHPDAHEANTLALEELKDGADAIALVFTGAASARGFGLPDNSPKTFESALKGIHLDLISTRLECSPFTGRATAEAFASYCAKNRLPGATIACDFGIAPIAAMAATGRMPTTFAASMDSARAVIADLQAKGFAGPFLRADSRPFADAGASEAQELAATLSQAVAYLRALVAKGMAAEEAASLISVTLSADDDQFLTIAKLRAYRLLHARVLEALGASARPVAIHVETGWRMLTKHDSYTNVLRNTIAAFAAGVAGADSLAVLPFTAALGLADTAARRLARNTSLILSEESNLHRVIDPAAGAGGIEALTDEIAAKAWALFQQIELQKADGDTGIVAALANGFIAEAIRDVRDARAKDLATRKQPMTGVSEFPDVKETPPHVLKAAPTAKAQGGLPAVRFAEAYEALRERALKAKSPKVFLANLGRIPDFNARATFAKNAFEAGGIVAIGNDGFAEENGTNLVAMTDAFKASGAKIACICSSDAIYAEEAADAATALIASGARRVYLAGKPSDLEAALSAAGVGGYVYVGANMLAFLDGALIVCEG
ncbi:MAG: methylmalonyl-CoA mutase family protein [Proteobacteria bacterium]|nr:methylmalonyl-CoA mutase family protein [Pseudomonadota bacterium]